MNNLKRNRKGITLIEVLLTLSIILIIAGWILRIFYSLEILKWEDGLYRTIGIDPDLARFVIGIVALIILATIAIKRRLARRRKNLFD